MKEGCRQIELEQQGMKVILEFPERSEHENVTQEVKRILSEVLRERMGQV